MPFPYYRRLSAHDKAIYRKSDSIARIDLPKLELAQRLALDIERALLAANKAGVEHAANHFARAVFDSLHVRRVHVHVRATRPSSSASELHGLYTFEDDDGPAKIEVWMRTAANKQVVRFPTFLRTLVHEMLHHLDLTHFALPETFHTEGFYRRESNLVRQLLPDRIRPPRKAKTAEPKASKAKSTSKPKKPRPSQLSLF